MLVDVVVFATVAVPTTVCVTTKSPGFKPLMICVFVLSLKPICTILFVTEVTVLLSDAAPNPPAPRGRVELPKANVDELVDPNA